MALAASSILLLDYPFQTYWLHIIGMIYYIFSVACLILFVFILILRNALFRDLNPRIWIHPTQSLYWGTLPVAVATIIAATAIIWQHQRIWICYVLWWLNFVLALVSAWGITFFSIVKHNRRIDIQQLNATILLPVLILVVQASAGAMVTKFLPTEWQAHMIIITALMWGNGEAIAFAFMVIYLWRLLTANLPARSMVFSCFIPIGPMGQGAHYVLVQSINLENYFIKSGQHPILKTFPVFQYLGTFLGLAMLGFATFWLVMAVFSCLYLHPHAFSITWWSMPYPIYTYAVSLYQISVMFDSFGFRVWCAVFATPVIISCLILTVVTIYQVISSDQIFRFAKEELDFYLEDLTSHSSKENIRYTSDAPSALENARIPFSEIMIGKPPDKLSFK